MKCFIYLTLLPLLATGCAHSDSHARLKTSSVPLANRDSTTPLASKTGRETELATQDDESTPNPTPYIYQATVISHIPEVRVEQEQADELTRGDRQDVAESSLVVYGDEDFPDGHHGESTVRLIGGGQTSLPSEQPAELDGGNLNALDLNAADRDVPDEDSIESGSDGPSDLNAATIPDEARVETLESLEQLAVTANPTLRELQARVQAAHGRWVQVGLRPNPVAGISAQEIGNDSRAGQFGAYVGQQYVTANKLGLSREAASWNLKRAKQELEAQRMRVVTDVRRGFYLVLVAQERVKVAGELADIAQQAVAKARELVKVQEPQTVLTQAEIEAELADVMVENAQAARDAQWRSLAATLGHPDLPRQDVIGSLSSNSPAIAWEEAMGRIRHESPELAAAVSRIEESRWQVHRARAEATPNVTMQAGVYYDDASNDPFASFQLSMPIPIHNRNQGGIATARANVTAATNAAQRIELRLQDRLAKVFQQYEQAGQQASRYEGTILAKTKRNLILNKQSYASGQSSYLAVLTAQRSYTEAHLTWLNSLERLWTATVQIEGLLLSENLAE